MFPEATSGKAGRVLSGKVQGLLRYNTERLTIESGHLSAGVSEPCRKMFQLDFHKMGFADEQVHDLQGRGT